MLDDTQTLPTWIFSIWLHAGIIVIEVHHYIKAPVKCTFIMKAQFWASTKTTFCTISQLSAFPSLKMYMYTMLMLTIQHMCIYNHSTSCLYWRKHVQLEHSQTLTLATQLWVLILSMALACSSPAVDHTGLVVYLQNGSGLSPSWFPDWQLRFHYKMTCDLLWEKGPLGIFHKNWVFSMDW